MIDVAHVFDLFARYAETARDFLFRLGPRRFAQIIRAGNHSYLKPFQFLVISLVISGVMAFTLAVFLLADSERETLFHIGILGCTAIIVGIWLENLFLLAAAKLAAFALALTAPLSDLLDGYCYASILFPFFIVSTEAAILGQEQPSVNALIVAGAVQLIFVALSSFAMTSFITIHPRYFWRMSLATFLVVIASASALLSAIDQIAKPGRYSVQPLAVARERLQNSFLAPSDFSVPGCNTATLNGHVVASGDEVTVWFEWGPTPELGNITITQRFMTSANYAQRIAGLKANTTYYYQAMSSSKNGSSKGRRYSFTTAHC